MNIKVYMLKIDVQEQTVCHYRLWQYYLTCLGMQCQDELDPTFIHRMMLSQTMRKKSLALLQAVAYCQCLKGGK